MNVNTNIKKLVYSALIGAIYAALTMVLTPISYGPLQLRLSELLCILPFFFPAAAGGLAVGCVIANTMSTAGVLDIVFGSLATLLAALCSAAVGVRARRLIARATGDGIIKNGGTGKLPSLWVESIAACAMPVLFNAPIVGAVLAYTLTPDEFWAGFTVFALQVGAGEAIVMFVMGLPLVRYMLKNAAVRDFFAALR